jgi:hypothetical protein
VLCDGLTDWPSRDPIEERGGLNLYGFVDNDSIRRFDLLGNCAGCCECATSIDITNIPYFEPEPLLGRNGHRLGHRLSITINLSYTTCTSADPKAKLEYVENTDVVPDFLFELGMRPNKDFDTYGALLKVKKSPPGFAIWEFRNEFRAMPCSGKRSILITDSPQMGVKLGEVRSTTTITEVRVTNPSACPLKSVSASWFQMLEFDGKKPYDFFGIF